MCCYCLCCSKSSTNPSSFSAARQDQNYYGEQDDGDEIIDEDMIDEDLDEMDIDGFTQPPVYYSDAYNQSERDGIVYYLL